MKIKIIFILLSLCITVKANLPEKIILQENISFPIIHNGKISGSLKVAKGNEVIPIKLENGTVLVRHNNLESKIPVEKTNLRELIEENNQQKKLLMMMLIKKI